jgi:hypothetical protein
MRVIIFFIGLILSVAPVQAFAPGIMGGGFTNSLVSETLYPSSNGDVSDWDYSGGAGDYTNLSTHDFDTSNVSTNTIDEYICVNVDNTTLLSIVSINIVGIARALNAQWKWAYRLADDINHDHGNTIVTSASYLQKEQLFGGLSLSQSDVNDMQICAKAVDGTLTHYLTQLYVEVYGYE